MTYYRIRRRYGWGLGRWQTDHAAGFTVQLGRWEIFTYRRSRLWLQHWRPRGTFAFGARLWQIEWRRFCVGVERDGIEILR